jgi:antitoxin MazE
MQVRIEQWSQSLALRIPAQLATQVHFEADSLVELEFSNGSLVVSPVSRTKVTLDQLLAGVTDENRHEEVTTGPAVGGEVW